MTRISPTRERDALLEPYSSTLPELPERQLLSGAGLALEASRFWAHRLQAYASYFAKLAQCADLTQIGALQATFWSDLQRDYANEGAAIAAAATLTGMPAFALDATPLPWPGRTGGQASTSGVH